MLRLVYFGLVLLVHADSVSVASDPFETPETPLMNLECRHRHR
jgi:hypothetical protein